MNEYLSIHELTVTFTNSTTCSGYQRMCGVEGKRYDYGCFNT